jgi:hypothetical protein
MTNRLRHTCALCRGILRKLVETFRTAMRAINGEYTTRNNTDEK